MTSPLAPYLLWAKTRRPAPFDLAGSNLLHCTLDDLPGARDAIELWVENEDGYPPIVDALAAHYGVASDQIVLAPGCSGANFVTIAALVGAGDDVLIERPTYDPLIGACRLLGAAVRRFDRRFDDAYSLNVEEVRAAITPRTRLIVVTTPHNPSGVAIDGAAMAELGRAAAEANAWVLVDEVYLDAANLIRTGARTPSAARIDGPFVVTSSLTKSYGLAGLRCGWAIAPPALSARLKRTRDLIDSISASPADRLSALAFALLPSLAARARALLSANTARAVRFFSMHDELETAEPPRASVCFPRLASGADAGPFVDRLLRERGVAVVPGTFFDAPRHFRLSLAGSTDVLEAGLSKIAEALKE
jgi:aspartate/methionine/tyrosine aminotransferase